MVTHTHDNMKKLLISLAIISLASSCAHDTFTIKGKVTLNDGVSENYIVLKDYFTDEKDSTLVSPSGDFTYKTEADVQTIKEIFLMEDSITQADALLKVIPEAATITVNLDNPNDIQGGVLNQELATYTEQYNVIYNEYEEEASKYSSTLSGTELNAAVENAADIAQSKLNILMEDTYNNNKTNGIGLMAFSELIYEYETIEDIDKALEGAGDFIKNSDKVSSIKDDLKAQHKSAEGMMFLDFKGEKADGTASSLSEYVGKGKWVLVDFWASWCNPCKREIPNLIAVSNKYGGKDLMVLGLPVWDKRPDTDKTIKKLGIEYTQLYVGDDRSSTDIYGINGIPHIILFAPDGTIAKRGLRGYGIEEAVKAALNK